MSLLEDIFLQDEADEAQELERVIEGDEYDERPRSRSMSPGSDENIIRDDEAEEDKRRVDPSSTKTKRVAKNPRFILNPARLTGPRGIQIIPDHFKDFKFKGKGHEKDDLDMVLKKLEHWAYRLYPKFQFEDCLKKIEILGKKRPVMVHLQKIRTDQFLPEDTVVQKDSSDEETQAPQEEDEFDKLLQQQIELARATPAPGSVRKTMETPRQDRSPFTMPRATSSPSISDEQKERMIRNRKLAEERRLARLKQNSMDTSEKQDSSSNISDIIEVGEENIESSVSGKKHNRSTVIDSSDDECDVTSVNQAVTVDVHSVQYIHEKIRGNNTDKDYVDDVEMEQNVREESVVESVVDKEVEVIDHAYKDVEIVDHVDKDVEYIDHVDKRLDKSDDKETAVVSHHYTDVIINNHIDEGVEEIVEINNENDEENGKISNNTEVIKENGGHLKVILNRDDRAQSCAVSSSADGNNSIKNQSKSPVHNDSIEKKNPINVEQNKTEESSIQHCEDKLQNDYESNYENKDEEKLEQLKDSNTENEIPDDTMDVDFNDDF